MSIIGYIFIVTVVLGIGLPILFRIIDYFVDFYDDDQIH